MKSLGEPANCREGRLSDHRSPPRNATKTHSMCSPCDQYSFHPAIEMLTGKILLNVNEAEPANDDVFELCQLNASKTAQCPKFEGGLLSSTSLQNTLNIDSVASCHNVV